MSKYGLRNNKAWFKEVKGDKVIVENKIPVQYIIPKTVAESTTALIEAWNVNSGGTAAKTNENLTNQPPYAMQISVQAVAAGTAGGGDVLAIVGYDAKGQSISENVAIQSTVGGINYSNNAFAKITSITPNSAAVKSTDVNIGYKGVIGLPYPLAQASDVISYTYDGAYGTAAVDSLTISTTYNTLTLPAMAASKTVSILYLSKLQD